MLQPAPQSVPATETLGRVRAIVIGASAGAVEMLSQILPALAPEFSLPIAIVVHLPPDRSSALPELFAIKSRIKIKEAEDKEPLQSGTVYFAPPNYHLLLESDATLSLSSDEPEMFSRPSIDLLFESAADALGGALLAIVLSGANSDGANGLRAVCEAGGLAWVQDPATALASAMPNAALTACPRAHVLTVEQMRDMLQAFKPGN